MTMDWSALTSITLHILGVAVLVVLNGFFVAAEFERIRIAETTLAGTKRDMNVDAHRARGRRVGEGAAQGLPRPRPVVIVAALRPEREGQLPILHIVRVAKRAPFLPNGRNIHRGGRVAEEVVEGSQVH